MTVSWRLRQIWLTRYILQTPVQYRVQPHVSSTLEPRQALMLLHSPINFVAGQASLIACYPLSLIVRHFEGQTLGETYLGVWRILVRN